MSSRDREARSLYDAGRIAFDEGRFENALDYFKRAYELSQRPGLLYNIGTTADRLRRDAEALEAFQAYLAAVPDASNRAQVEARIAFLQRAVEQQQLEAQQQQQQVVVTTPTETAPPPDTATVEPTVVAAEPSDSGPPAALSWALIGGGGGAAVAGAVLLGIGQAHRSKIENAEPGSSWSDVSQYDNADGLTGAGVALLGVGIAAATVGLVIMLTSGDDDEAPSTSLILGPSSILVRGTM